MHSMPDKVKEMKKTVRSPIVANFSFFEIDLVKKNRIARIIVIIPQYTLGRTSSPLLLIVVVRLPK